MTETILSSVSHEEEMTRLVRHFWREGKRSSYYRNEIPVCRQFRQIAPAALLESVAAIWSVVSEEVHPADIMYSFNRDLPTALCRGLTIWVLRRAGYQYKDMCLIFGEKTQATFLKVHDSVYSFFSKYMDDPEEEFVELMTMILLNAELLQKRNEQCLAA